MKPDGGPANGVSLRDYMAVAALQGWLASLPDDVTLKHDFAAKQAYLMADAMMKEREK